MVLFFFPVYQKGAKRNEDKDDDKKKTTDFSFLCFSRFTFHFVRSGLSLAWSEANIPIPFAPHMAFGRTGTRVDNSTS